MTDKEYRKKYAVMYPGVDIPEPVFKALKKGDRKEEYMTVDLKTEQPLKNQDGILIDLLPSREDSYDRLLAVDKQFAAENTTADEVCARHEWIAELHRCLALLKDDERALIQALYFDGQTECEYADQIGRKQQSVNERRQRILAKLKKLMKF